ncbi:FHA domain-containing protein [bacterium]|nr:FHA domain-containing protein [bacterium]
MPSDYYCPVQPKPSKVSVGYHSVVVPLIGKPRSRLRHSMLPLPPVYAPPPPLPPTQGVQAMPTPPVVNFPATEAATAGNVGGGGNYGRPGGVGVQKTELAQAEPQILAWLIERNGSRAGREHRLREQVTIGRDPARCEIVLDDGKVSGEHARIRLEKGQYVLYDLASTNHTFVNGQEVQKHILRDGDQIRFGTNATTSFMLAGK